MIWQKLFGQNSPHVGYELQNTARNQKRSTKISLTLKYMFFLKRDGTVNTPVCILSSQIVYPVSRERGEEVSGCGQ